MKKVGFASGEVSLLRRLLDGLDDWHVREEADGEMPGGWFRPVWSKQDRKAAQSILTKLKKAEQPSDPAVNAPALEETLVTYAGVKMARLALPNWARYARQAADVGANIADAQVVGTWIARQGWIRPNSLTLDSVLRNWPSWLGKARAEQTTPRQAGFNGDVERGTAPQRAAAPGGRPAPGFGRKNPSARADGIPRA